MTAIRIILASLLSIVVIIGYLWTTYDQHTQSPNKLNAKVDADIEINSPWTWIQPDPTTTTQGRGLRSAFFASASASASRPSSDGTTEQKSTSNELSADEDALVESMCDGCTMTLPLPSGEFCDFLLTSSTVLSTRLAQLAGILAFHGSISDDRYDDQHECSQARAVLDWSPITGFHGQISTLAQGIVYVDPMTLMRSLVDVTSEEEDGSFEHVDTGNSTIELLSSADMPIYVVYQSPNRQKSSGSIDDENNKWVCSAPPELTPEEAAQAAEAEPTSVNETRRRRRLMDGLGELEESLSNDMDHSTIRREKLKRNLRRTLDGELQADIADMVSSDYYVPRRFTIAIVVSAEYTAVFGGTLQGALAAVATTISRVSGIFERDFGIELVLAEDQDLLIQVEVDTPLLTPAGVSVPVENTKNTLRGMTDAVNSIIGKDSYDVGHLFITEGGGVAEIGVVCNDRRKAQGVSGSTSPFGDAFHVDYCAHEIAHQFGATHTFNGLNGACGAAGNYASVSAVEPGSGSTVMGYAGICETDNLQGNSDAYFHIVSVAQVTNLLAAKGSTCGTQAFSGEIEETQQRRQRPSITLSKTAFHVPIGTPFELSVANPLFGILYSWEQVNAGISPQSFANGISGDWGGATAAATGASPKEEEFEIRGGTENTVSLERASSKVEASLEDASIYGTVETRLDVTPHVAPGFPRFRSYMPSSAGYKRSFPAMESLLVPRTGSSVTQVNLLSSDIETINALDYEKKDPGTQESQNLGDEDGDISSTSLISPALARLGERLAYEPEVLMFAATARKPGGGFNTATMRVEVEDVGPMRVLSPSMDGEVLYNFSSVTWDTNGAETLAFEVDILLSLDGGTTWPHSLGRVPNNGILKYAILPTSICTTSGASVLTKYTDARVMIASVAREGHRFFTISDFPITVSCSSLTTSLVIVVATAIGVSALVGIIGLLVAFRMLRSRKQVLVAESISEDKNNARPHLTADQSSEFDARSITSNRKFASKPSRWSRFSYRSSASSQSSATSGNPLAHNYGGRKGRVTDAPRPESEFGMGENPAELPSNVLDMSVEDVAGSVKSGGTGALAPVNMRQNMKSTPFSSATTMSLPGVIANGDSNDVNNATSSGTGDVIMYGTSRDTADVTTQDPVLPWCNADEDLGVLADQSLMDRASSRKSARKLAASLSFYMNKSDNSNNNTKNTNDNNTYNNSIHRT